MNIAFDSDAVAALLGAMNDHVATMRAARRGLDDSVTTLRAGWSGEAQRTHGEVHRRWSDDVSTSHERARRLLDDARESAARLARSEEDATALWR